LKLHLGCGDIRFDSPWINCDFNKTDATDVVCDCAKLPHEDNSVDEIYSSHLIEHFNFREAWDVLKEWKRVLQPDGWLVIECPDFYASCKGFVEAYEQGKMEADYWYPHFFGMDWLKGGQHKMLYSPQQMEWTLQQTGFRNIYQKPALRYISKEQICMKFLCQK
jgi:predicted SAM-dependent methyltransferase